MAPWGCFWICCALVVLVVVAELLVTRVQCQVLHGGIRKDCTTTDCDPMRFSPSAVVHIPLASGIVSQQEKEIWTKQWRRRQQLDEPVPQRKRPHKHIDDATTITWDNNKSSTVFKSKKGGKAASAKKKKSKGKYAKSSKKKSNKKVMLSFHPTTTKIGPSRSDLPSLQPSQSHHPTVTPSPSMTSYPTTTMSSQALLPSEAPSATALPTYAPVQSTFEPTSTPNMEGSMTASSAPSTCVGQDCTRPPRPI